MAILQRTPPARRPVAGVEIEPATSSPSRSRLIRSSERPPADAYVFPSLDAIAAERQAAMSMAARNSPILAISSNVRDSIDVSGGSLGTSSASSRKVLGGQVGRNGPVLSVTVARTHPAIGESQSRESQSPRPISNSFIPRPVVSPKKSAQVLSRDQSPAIPIQPERIERSTSRDAKVVGIPSSTVDKSAFEAQMERALASGADPFQDRKRDLMRGDSRMPAIQHKEEVANSPRRIAPKSSEANTSSKESPLPKLAKLMNASDYTPRATPPQSPHVRAKIPVEQRVMYSPGSQSAREVVSTLKAQMKEKIAQLEKAKDEAAKAQQALKEKQQLDRQQKDKIKSLERRILDQGLKEGEKDTTQLRLVAFEWDFLREKYQMKMARGEESREREIEAIISRNEVSYMDARRAEGELDLQVMQYEVNRMQALLSKAEKERRQLHSIISDTEREKKTLEREQTALQSSERKLEETLAAERERRDVLEADLEVLNKRLAKEEGEARNSKQKQLHSPVRREATKAETRKSSPAPRMEKSDKVTASPSKGHAETIGKTAKEVSETVRQSPRKKLSAFVRSTSAKIQSTVMRQSDSIWEDEQEDDGAIKEAAPPPTASKKKETATKTKRKETVSEEVEGSGDEVEKKGAPKKKTNILSRGKKASEKSVKPSSKRRSDVRDEEVRMEEELEREIQQTPMIIAKKRKGKDEFVRASNGDVSLNAEATPIVKPKTKQQAVAKLIEDTTKTPVIRSKKRKEDEAPGKSMEVSTDETSHKDDGLQKKKKRRILKQSTNVANGFLNCDGDGEGDLDPKLNLPLQLSPIKGGPSSTTTLGTRGAAAATGRLFNR